MKKILYIESSPRKDRSHSINVTNKYIEKIKASGDIEIKKIDLWNYDLPEFDGDTLNAKYAAISGSEASAPENNAWAKVIEIFNEFQDADHYIFSVPMWNFSIP